MVAAVVPSQDLDATLQCAPATRTDIWGTLIAAAVIRTLAMGSLVTLVLVWAMLYSGPKAHLGVDRFPFCCQLQHQVPRWSDMMLQ